MYFAVAQSSLWPLAVLGALAVAYPALALAIPCTPTVRAQAGRARQAMVLGIGVLIVAVIFFAFVRP
jgi:hypothetical protein